MVEHLPHSAPVSVDVGRDVSVSPLIHRLSMRIERRFLRWNSLRVTQTLCALRGNDALYASVLSATFLAAAPCYQEETHVTGITTKSAL